MLVISPPSASSTAARPGLREVADAMHAAWVNFIVSTAGDPSPVGGRGWPAFVSPFDDGRGTSGGRGRVVVFGEGNNERDPESRVKSAGTAVGLESLTEWELERCRFWWGRVELSEGLGRRLDRGKL